MRLLVKICLPMLLASSPALADDWFVSKFGKDDTLGAINHINADKTKYAAGLVKQGKTISLGMVTGADTPAYGPRKFQMIVHQLNDGSGATLGSGKTVGNDDTVITSVGIGSQLDGLGHIGRDHVYYNNRKSVDVVAPDGLLSFGTHALPGIVTRGVVLDMTKINGQDPVPSGTVFTEADIKRAAHEQGIEIAAGDVVLFHSGFLKATEGQAQLSPGLPGLGVSGAHYLARLGVAAIGADTWGLEVLPSEDQTDAFPVHRILLAKYGVYILENMTTHKLVDAGIDEFMFTLGVPRLKGAVQAIINPLAIY